MDAAEVRKSAALRLPAWNVAEDGRSLSRTHEVASFVAGIDWFNAITPIAEAEGHHPDLSLVDWNIASVRLSTHVRCLVIFSLVLSGRVVHYLDWRLWWCATVYFFLLCLSSFSQTIVRAIVLSSVVSVCPL